eukprot:gene13076-15382_t
MSWFFPGSYGKGIFPSQPEATIGSAFFSKTIEFDGGTINIEIWDTAGQERYRALTPLYYRGSEIAILVYDVTQPNTFEQVKEWAAELKRNLSDDIYVGKTAIAIRYAEGIFPTRPLSTVGASFLTKNINFDGQIKVKYQIWDTAGQDRFRSLAPMYYRGASVAVLVFDVTLPKTFEKVKEWVVELRQNIQDDIILVVCGNKIDLQNQRQVRREVAKAYSDEIKAIYYETSAKDNEGIDQMFLDIAKKLLVKHQHLYKIEPPKVAPAKSSCCS